MLKKSEKLSKKDFSVISNKKILRGQYLDIGYLLSSKTKVAVVVSKKISKRAVDRNKIKRKVFNIFKEIKLKNNYFIVFYPKKETLYLPYEKLKLSILEMSDKIQ